MGKGTKIENLYAYMCVCMYVFTQFELGYYKNVRSALKGNVNSKWKKFKKIKCL